MAADGELFPFEILVHAQDVIDNLLALKESDRGKGIFDLNFNAEPFFQQCQCCPNTASPTPRLYVTCAFLSQKNIICQVVLVFSTRSRVCRETREPWLLATFFFLSFFFLFFF